MRPRITVRIEGLTPGEVDRLLREFPVLRAHAAPVTIRRKPGDQYEGSLIGLGFELLPDVLEAITAGLMLLYTMNESRNKNPKQEREAVTKQATKPVKKTAKAKRSAPRKKGRASGKS